MRLFIACELPQETHDALSETSALLRDRLRGRFVAPDSFHVTLAFLGEVPAADLPRVCDALDEACVGQRAVRAKLGAFGSFGRARRATLWQGFSEGVDELAALAGDVRQVLGEEGLPFDPAAFVPHVTLMRGVDLSDGELPTPIVERGTFDTVTLFSSDLTGERPRYEALHSVRLDPPAEDQGELWVPAADIVPSVDYGLLASQLRALAEGETLLMPVLANASALLMEALPDVSWAGFYLAHGGELVLGPFQGKVACTHIAWGAGVCGTAARLDETQLVPDVHAFPGHIACDSASRSEVVVPIHASGRVMGVVDLDSTSSARFGTADACGLERVVAALEELLPSLGTL